MNTRSQANIQTSILAQSYINAKIIFINLDFSLSSHFPKPKWYSWFTQKHQLLNVFMVLPNIYTHTPKISQNNSTLWNKIGWECDLKNYEYDDLTEETFCSNASTTDI